MRLKAIFIPFGFGHKDLEILNSELKDVTSIIKEVNAGDGTVLIVKYITRTDKLKKINEIAK